MGIAQSYTRHVDERVCRTPRSMLAGVFDGVALTVECVYEMTLRQRESHDMYGPFLRMTDCILRDILQRPPDLPMCINEQDAEAVVFQHIRWQRCDILQRALWEASGSVSPNVLTHHIDAYRQLTNRIGCSASCLGKRGTFPKPCWVTRSSTFGRERRDSADVKDNLCWFAGVRTNICACRAADQSQASKNAPLSIFRCIDYCLSNIYRSRLFFFANVFIFHGFQSLG